jgi:hypothetical protein
MNRLLSYSLFAALAGFGLAGCYPAGPDYTEDLDVVYTTYDPEFDFVSRNTYAMPDQIVTDVQITNSGDTTYEYMKDVYAGPILDRIDANMASLGWTKVDVSADPNVLLMPAGISSTTYFYSYWYDWWYGGYWGYWGWYYPPYYTVSSYTTGSLIMTIADPNIDSPVNRSPVAWIGAMNGLLTYSGNINRVLDGVDKAFLQSPYLKTN